MNKSIKILALSVLALSICGCNIKNRLRQVATPSGPVTVTVSRVGPDERHGGPAYIGTVSAQRSASISAPAPGTLENLTARAGMRVAKGQVLGKINSQTVESAHKAAQSQLSQAEDALKRMKDVYEGGAVAEIEYISIKTKVEEAKAAEAAARDALERCTIKAPFSGVVDKVWPVEGTDVTLAQPILSVIDLSSLEVHFPLPESEYHLYSERTPASIEIPALDKTVQGIIRSKGIVASSLSHSYDCIVSLADGRAAGLMPGMVCKVRPQSEGGSRAVIPASAVMTDTKGRYVWTATDDVVDKKYVTLGGFSGDGVIVVEGVVEGDMVIVDGARKVSTGMKVKTIVQ